MEAYLFLREKNQTVPSDTLELMKDAAIKSLVTDEDLASVRSSHFEDIRKELQEFFANNMVSYWRIEEFELQANHLNTGFNIIPKEPYFDESYSDDEADKRIEAIGKKYGVKLGWIYWVYPK